MRDESYLYLRAAWGRHLFWARHTSTVVVSEYSGQRLRTVTARSDSSPRWSGTTTSHQVRPNIESTGGDERNYVKDWTNKEVKPLVADCNNNITFS